MTQAALYKLSPETRMLRQYLRTVAKNAVVTFAQMSEQCGVDVQKKPSVIASARHGLLGDAVPIVIASVRGVGVIRLDDAGIVESSDHDIDMIRRKARRSVRKITAVADFAAMPPKLQLAHTVRLSIFTAVASMASDAGMKKIEPMVSAGTRELPISETLRAFR